MDKKNLNLQELITGPITRLSHIRRWAASRGNRRESVADHSYYVTLYCLMIHRWWSSFGGPIEKTTINLADLLTRAVMHDVEECYLGDIPAPIKHGNEKTRQSLDQVAQGYVEEMAETWSNDCHIADMTVSAWYSAKDITPIGRIVEFAEALSCLSYIAQEVQSNPGFIKDVTEFPQYMERFEEVEYDFIRPLVTDAFRIMDGIFPRRR